MSEFYEETLVRKTIESLKPNGQLFEVRVIGSGSAGKKILSGYFRSADTLIEAFRTVNLRDTNVYLTLNYINEACYSRTQKDKFLVTNNTTSDKDIIGYQWMLIDLDPERATGVSSSDEELKAAGEVGGKVYKYLKDIGFSEPVKALSGSGYHLVYRIALENTQENVNLVKRCLEALSDMFSTDTVKLDVVNFNPSRICKLHGSLAQKGSNTSDRPHRMSRIFSNPPYEVTPKKYLEKLAGQISDAPKAPIPNYHREEFNVQNFLDRHQVGYKILSGSGRDSSTVYSLSQCPFDSNHTNGDAKVFSYPDGRIAFKCHHNSCSDKRWRDFRLFFEPDAYSKSSFDNDYEAGWREHNRNKQKSASCDVQETDNPEEMFRTAEEIWNDDEPKHEFVLSGISEIDRVMHGLQKQSISMISGLRASGKSTLIGNVILKAVDDGHTVVVYSGELSNKKYLNWITKQAAGINSIEVSMEYENGYGVSAEVQEKINAWMGNRFWLYNNKFGNDFRKISDSLRTILSQKKADICIIDNLMALDLSALDKRDKWEAQTKFVWELKEIAELTNTHILFVAHPKKASGLIRLEDVSGTGNITNIIDNAFMVHRVNLDFAKRFKETFGELEYKKNIPEDATNVIEIAKDRENGTMDYFIPLYFEPETKRMRNNPAEYIHYKWEPDEVAPLEDELSWVNLI